MPWSETIRFDRPLRHVSLQPGTGSPDWAAVWERSLQQAREEGRREGERLLSEQLIRQRNELAEVQRRVWETLRRAVPEVLRQAESLLVPLALEAARRIVAEIPIDATLVERVVREALRQAEETAEVVIRLHPEDLALLRQHGSHLLQAPPETGSVRFVASSEISRGGCVIQTRFGIIDARRETKLGQLQQALTP
ncbi:MAG: FliH/SctL family protein [Verrucomicrobiota bacterium]|nr:FliH/SctL family protein [Limisphaera sp.]MDW8381043.1 FliH/SctL family protein [Verrucomicrobiota bacterium]